jgi:hypothetical protein
VHNIIDLWNRGTTGPNVHYLLHMRIALVVLPVVFAVFLAGCSPDETSVLPQPVPSSTPIFASDEEALAAAEAAFTRYLAVVDQIFADGGQGVERLEEVATAEVVEQESIGFGNFQARGHYTVGATSFDSMSLQIHDPGANEGFNIITTYACEDFGATQIFDTSGQSLTPDGRQTRWPVVVTFDVDSANDRLEVSEIDDWTGSDFCVE